MSTLKDIVATKPEIKKPKILNAVQEDWTSYCYNFGMRVAALPEEDSRDKIRMGMEQLYFDEKQKKQISEFAAENHLSLTQMLHQFSTHDTVKNTQKNVTLQ